MAPAKRGKKVEKQAKNGDVGPQEEETAAASSSSKERKAHKKAHDEQNGHTTGKAKGLLAECEALFGVRCLYQVLHLGLDGAEGKDDGEEKKQNGKGKGKKASTAAAKGGQYTEDQIRRGYYKASLRWHPDRWAGAEHDEKQRVEATHRFQTLGRVYAVLCDKGKRDYYDKTGEVDEDNVLLSGEEGDDFLNHWRSIFKKVTKEDIDRFAAEYQGSEEEREDVRLAYLKCKGDLGKIMEHIMCAKHEDEVRVEQICQKLIESGQLEQLPAFEKSRSEAAKQKRKRKADRESKEAAEYLAEIEAKETGGRKEAGGAAPRTLQQAIQQRMSDRAAKGDAFLDGLAEKHAKKPKAAAKGEKKKKKKSKKEEEEEEGDDQVEEEQPKKKRAKKV